MKRIVFTFFLMCFATNIYAQNWMGHLALFYASEEGQREDSEFDVTKTVFHLGIGADVSDGFYIGGKYFEYNEDWGGSNGPDEKITSLGISLGYFHNSGFFLMYTHLLDPEKTVNTTSNNSSVKATYSDGGGSLIDIGYLVKSGNLAYGPMITQANVTYSKVSASGTDTDLNNTSDTLLYPYFIMVFYF